MRVATKFLVLLFYLPHKSREWSLYFLYYYCMYLARDESGHYIFLEYYYIYLTKAESGH